jgi:hypothetical protein
MDLLTQQNMLYNIKNMVDILPSLASDAAAVHKQLIVIRSCLQRAFTDAIEAFQYVDRDAQFDCMERLLLTERACGDALIKRGVIILPEEHMQATINCTRTLLDVCISALRIINAAD